MTIRAIADSKDELEDKINMYRLTMAPLGDLCVSAGKVLGVWTADLSVESWIK